jgi:hypothetical protein
LAALSVPVQLASLVVFAVPQSILSSSKFAADDGAPIPIAIAHAIAAILILMM